VRVHLTGDLIGVVRLERSSERLTEGAHGRSMPRPTSTAKASRARPHRDYKGVAGVPQKPISPWQVNEEGVCCEWEPGAPRLSAQATGGMRTAT